MYQVTVKTVFSAAHQLRGYDGQYENLHGHNWTAVVIAESGELDAMGVGIDFVNLKKKTDEALSALDYHNINEVAPFDNQNPSAENIARWLFEKLSAQLNTESVKIRRVEISETPECGAAYFE